MNVADFIIDITSIDNRSEEAEMESTKRVAELVAYWKSSGKIAVSKLDSSNVKERVEFDTLTSIPSNRRQGANWVQQITVLTHRGWKNFLQDKLMLYGTILQVVFVATFVGFIFFKLDENLPGILSRKAIFYLSASCMIVLYFSLTF